MIGVFTVLLLLCFPFIISLQIIKWFLRNRSKTLLREWQKNTDSTTIAFFHPYCNSGGGGERVLWKAISAMHERYPEVVCIVYTGDNNVSDEDIILSVEKRFNIKIKNSVHFVHLSCRKLLEAKVYPRFTLIGQSLGSIFLAIEAAFKFMPSVFFDSTGFAFTLPVFKLLGVRKLGCYVHYPTISTDMLNKVSDRADTYNNATVVSKSQFLSSIKLIYYKCFARLYGFVGCCADLIMVNSSWTNNHILSLWNQKDKTKIVYPPCNIEEFEKISVEFSNRKNYVISIGQFRPEKDHELQLRSFKRLLSMLEIIDRKDVKLILIGSCRNTEDEIRTQKLKVLCETLEIQDSVIFKLNVPFPELIENVETAKVGLHTMWNEHFGIGVVECMAAGLIMVAHNSGGPKLDIVSEKDDKTGYLADDENSYSQAMYDIIMMDNHEALKITNAARKSVKKFSDAEFCNSFLDCFKTLF